MVQDPVVNDVAAIIGDLRRPGHIEMHQMIIIAHAGYHLQAAGKARCPPLRSGSTSGRGREARISAGP
ncbi:hypothetical protein GCM10009125_20460 [Castellaniella daejeonensis]|uniref:Uncharacterized protein n=1 Tax=Castellaniella daejeonensis TaxID=659013 RepID=A0ABN0TVN6_9BURK